MYVYMLSLPVVSSRLLTVFGLMKTDERCDLWRAVASAVTYNTLFQNPSVQ